MLRRLHVSRLSYTVFYLFFWLTLRSAPFSFFFFFNDTATTEIYTLSLHDALPISIVTGWLVVGGHGPKGSFSRRRSEEHTSELQSRLHLVCRLLLEKKKKHQDERR